MGCAMYELDAAFFTSENGLDFARIEDVPDTHKTFCELRVTFGGAIYPPEPDVGVGVTCDPSIAKIEMRPWGNSIFLTDANLKQNLNSSHWRDLSDEAFRNAKSFILNNYADDLWIKADIEAERYWRAA